MLYTNVIHFWSSLGLLRSQGIDPMGWALKRQAPAFCSHRILSVRGLPSLYDEASPAKITLASADSTKPTYYQLPYAFSCIRVPKKKRKGEKSYVVIVVVKVISCIMFACRSISWTAPRAIQNE
ncbi:hypothetical protein P691DRAFT_386415 [Macrolepiota fuliginosa MF-IS2]|uniref:Uncharacterized protein n=1 Tax=Macrolepiota fuliginosa MF-IS2 TaxID=1400762 RepID=A0A9P6C7D9_9AGAR|nr:hypothetical protein P691DRAFT_386415 [Macrolepiota fuliginosa MF-IS2]